MKILVYGLNFAPELTGIGKYTGEMVAYLVSHGHQVTVITAPPYYPSWQVDESYSAWGYRRQTWAGATVIRCPLWVPKNPNGLSRLLHLASFALSSLFPLFLSPRYKPDLVFNIVPALMTSLPAALYAKLVRAKSWLHIHDFEIDAAYNLGLLQNDSFRKIFVTFEKWLFRLFDTVSTISNQMIQKLLDKGVPSEKSKLFFNWVDQNIIHPLSEPDDSFHQQLNIAPSDTVLLYAGNMGKKQGLEILVEVAKLLETHQSIHVVIAGDGVEKQNLIEASQGMSNIHFLPLQPLEKLNELLNFADIHVLPQKPGAADLVMPSKLAGMLSSGKPVIALANPGSEVYDIVSKHGLVCPTENIEVFLQEIVRLAQDPALQHDLGVSGRRYIEENLAKEKVLAKFNADLIAEISNNDR